MLAVDEYIAHRASTSQQMGGGLSEREYRARRRFSDADTAAIDP
ncbi:MAG: hypothetical protein P8L39_05005 [Halioglobus sp.]|nr:hypothetical protein [Halioglobus sp.]